jgi:butyryl-CoA dehydrogenase/short/branched chain acyl-CoA dehydrogenase
MPETATLPAGPLTVLNDEELMLQEEVRRFADETVRPLIAESDREGKLPPSIVPALFEMGLMAVEIPEKLGGAEMPFSSAIIAIEELARVDPSVSVVMDVHNTLVNNCILRWSSDQQKARWCPRLSSEIVGAYALSEADAGSDAFALKCKAVKDGDGWVLNGQKLWITNGAEAGLFIIFANANPEAGYKGITAFVVDVDTPGFTVGKKEDKVGIRASSTVEVLLDDCRVSDDDVLGEVGKGYKVAIETLNEGRIGIGAQMVGLAQGALDQTVAYVKERVQFGKPLAKFQGIQFALAEMECEIEAARLTVYNAARLKDAGKPFVREAAIAKWFAAEVAERVSSKAVDLFGGYGFTKDYPVEKLWRDSKIGKIYEGTSFMQLQTIAKMLLG